MKKTTLLVAAVAMLLAPAALFAQKENPPAPSAPKNFNVPRVTRFELPNGLRVRLVPYGEMPKVTVRLVTRAGNGDEGPNETWLADLTGDLLQQGTANRTAAQLAEDFAMMGGALNVGVGVNQTSLTADVFSESGPKAVATIADVVRNPLFPASELERLKKNRVRTLSIALSQQQSLATQKFNSVLYPNHAYGRLYPTQPMLEAYTLDQVRGFFNRNFSAARSAVYVAGKFDSPAMESAIRKSFADWKAGTPSPAVTITPASGRKVYLVDRPGAVQSTVVIGLPTIGPSDADYVPLIVTDSLLGGSFASRITSNIREQKGYTYSPGSEIDTHVGAGAWNETADVTTNVTGPSIKEILGEIDRLRAEPPTKDEVLGIQRNEAGVFVLRNSSRAGIVNQISFLDLYGLSEDYLRNYVQRVYAVTPADIQRVARTYLDPSKMAIVVVGDKKAIAAQITPYGTIVE